MKQRIFVMLAAMLLSIGAFAQNGTLEGDVNNDGTVDVADIVGIIRIMKEGGGAVGEKMCYWYAGTNNGNAVTEDNFIDVASRIAESEIPGTGSVASNGQYVYFVMPETKHLESLVDDNGSAVEYSYTDVMGYHIYKTMNTISGTISYIVEQTTYYWYVGTGKFTTDEQIEANGTPINSSSDIPNPFTINEPTGESFVYLYYPKAFGTATLTSSGLPLAGKDVSEFTTQGFELINYNGWRIPKGADGAVVNITFNN